MTNLYIKVPNYVAAEFCFPREHTETQSSAIEQSLATTYRRIANALEGLDPSDWEVDGGRYRSVNLNEPYGFEYAGGKFYIYAEERGRRSAMAIFRSGHLAADYFIWLVSKGTRSIDWSAHLEMEP